MIETLSKNSTGIIDAPIEFTQKHPFEYPPGNRTEFERWFFIKWQESDERQKIYLPIFWTAYLVKSNYGTDKVAIKKLQDFVDSLNRTKKYYSICQYDDGCKIDFKDLDIKIFSMSGSPIHYPLPLIYESKRFAFSQKKIIKANFVGKITHPVREKLIEKLKNNPSCYISTAYHNPIDYCKILSQSVFTLCPRGYGPTSFRIQEAIQYGSIPIYISDNHIIPHNVPFEQYGILVHNGQIHNIKEIIRSIPQDEIKRKQDILRDIYNTYYTYPANKQLIIQNLS